jgi:hydrogenase maturation protein HypF
MIHPPAPLLIDSRSQRLHLKVQGMLQGVGFRPFVYTLATELGLGGWVCNSDGGVDIEVEGDTINLSTFLERLERDRPTHSFLVRMETNWLPPLGDKHFEIHSSEQNAPTKSVWILPDLATCPDCLQEIFDPRNRRYHYPFTNCTHCGPRYSILTALPYDRPNTTMQAFQMCSACQQEYDNPHDRRFYAQPNACPVCGPYLELWDCQGKAIASESASSELISQAAHHLRQGKILALKGLGGFHLMVDARNEEAVQRLRDRKHRPTKPLAVMYPNLEAIHQDCLISPIEQNLLRAPVAPIVLLRRKSLANSDLAFAIAPHQNTLGVMLPYTPLHHHLLLAELGFPVVATSGNRSQEPICIDNAEALQQLSGIADVFLLHNRPIVRPVDDSVVRVIADCPMVLRRARGYAPSPIAITQSNSLPCILSVGGHLKNTIALSLQNQIILSQHLGDLDQAQARDRFQETIDQLLTLYQVEPVAIACDAHPDYVSTHFAQVLSQQRNIPVMPIQHHYAHVLSGMVDNNLKPPVFGVAWDGTGYGLDGTIWGGEFLTLPDSSGFQRISHLRTFPLPGGDRAIREPRRAALGLLYEAFGEAVFELDCPTLQAFQPQELKLLRTMLQNGANTPRTSSVGRLFDAIASLTGLCQQATFEGEAAMQLESSLKHIYTAKIYPYELEQNPDGTLILDWKPMLITILNSRDSIDQIAARFHNTLVEMMVAIAHKVAIPQVVLSGGCFQNRYLLERAIQRLRVEGFEPHWHHHIPPNDGGIATGQILGAHWMFQNTERLFEKLHPAMQTSPPTPLLIKERGEEQVQNCVPSP